MANFGVSNEFALNLDDRADNLQKRKDMLSFKLQRNSARYTLIASALDRQTPQGRSSPKALPLPTLASAVKTHRRGSDRILILLMMSCYGARKSQAATAPSAGTPLLDQDYERKDAATRRMAEIGFGAAVKTLRNYNAPREV